MIFQTFRESAAATWDCMHLDHSTLVSLCGVVTTEACHLLIESIDEMHKNWKDRRSYKYYTDLTNYEKKMGQVLEKI